MTTSAIKELRVLALIPGKAKSESFIFARRQVKQLAQLGAAIECCFLEARTSVPALLASGRELRRVAREHRAHVVHSHYGTVTSLVATLFSPVPVVITYRGSDLNPSSEFSAPRAISSRLMSQFSAPLASEIICVSEELRSRLWWRRGAVHVIPTGIDLEEFIPLSRAEARAKVGWSGDQRIALLNIGASRSPNKGLSLVESAMQIVKREIPDARLQVLDGTLPAAQMPLYLNAADVVVMASRHEGSPNVVKEALACNVPLCSVRVGDVPQMAADVQNVMLVDPTSEAMAAGLITLMRDPVRSNGRDYSSRFSSRLLTDEVMKVLMMAASRRKRS